MKMARSSVVSVVGVAVAVVVEAPAIPRKARPMRARMARKTANKMSQGMNQIARVPTSPAWQVRIEVQTEAQIEI